MSEPTKVFLVSQGNYSDYQIVAAFSTREKAEAFVAESSAKAMASTTGDGEWKLSYGEDMSIEEYELDTVQPPQRGAFVVSLSINSPYSSFGGAVYARWAEDADPSAPATASRDKYHPQHISVTGYGETREHARRSASELHRAIVAGTVVIP